MILDFGEFIIKFHALTIIPKSKIKFENAGYA